MDPVVCVEVGDDKKYTSMKESTNCPYYNEVSGPRAFAVMGVGTKRWHSPDELGLSASEARSSSQDLKDTEGHQ